MLQVREKIFTWLFLLGLIEASSGFAASITPTEALNGYINRIATLEAVFTQSMTQEDGDSVQEANGTFQLSRPGKFRWNYESPFEQQIVSDGESLWLYDVELEQVTVKRLDETLANSPALLLGGNVSIEDNFDVTYEGDVDNVAWFGLAPIVKDSDFIFVRIGFRDAVPSTMILQDTLGQTTTINFTEFTENPELPESLFVFDPPENVDVIGLDDNTQ